MISQGYRAGRAGDDYPLCPEAGGDWIVMRSKEWIAGVKPKDGAMPATLNSSHRMFFLIYGDLGCIAAEPITVNLHGICRYSSLHSEGSVNCGYS
jgi:hypothetical protein